MDFAPYQSSPPEHGRTFSPPESARASPRTSFDRTGSGFGGFGQRSPPPLHHPQPQRAWSGDGIRSPPGGEAGGYQSPSQQYQYQQQQQQQPQQQPTGWGAGNGMGDYFNALGQREGMVSEFDTSLGLRLDYEACLAYLAFPPLGAILLLILERKSDYVRFHAWQSSLLFTGLFVIHLLFSWSTFLSWFIFFADLALIAWLVLQAYKDADTLDRYEVPIVGPIASRILDDE